MALSVEEHVTPTVHSSEGQSGATRDEDRIYVVIGFSEATNAHFEDLTQRAGDSKGGVINKVSPRRGSMLLFAVRDS